jgi:hypothetical protein
MNQENSLEIIKEEIAPGILVYSNVMPNSNALYEKIKEGISAEARWIISRWTYAEADDLQNSMNLNLNDLFFKYFNPIEIDYKSFYSINPDLLQWHDVYGIMKYGLNQFFNNHIDDCPDYRRMLSAVYYLNDNYLGGEIIFPRFNIKFKPKANQMILFPSNHVYNHSVSPIVEGEKYCVVSWLR